MSPRSLMAAIAAERQAARRARRGLSAGAPQARLSGMVKRLQDWDVGQVRAGRHRRRGDAHLPGQARRRGRIAFDGDDPAALHALRARVVDLRYQLALIALAWPEAINAQAERLDELRDTLGAFNDLYMLAKFATERGGLSAQAHEVLTERIGAKQKKLRRRGKTEFDRLFAETPNSLAKRLSAYLKHPMEKPDGEKTVSK